MRRAKAASHRLRRHLCLPGGVSTWRFIATPYEPRHPILHSFDDFVTESGSPSRVEGPRWGAIRKPGQADLGKRPLCPGQRMRCCRKVEKSVQNWGYVSESVSVAIIHGLYSVGMWNSFQSIPAPYSSGAPSSSPFFFAAFVNSPST